MRDYAGILQLSQTKAVLVSGENIFEQGELLSAKEDQAPANRANPGNDQGAIISVIYVL